jgi:hypothetical protein
VQHPCGITHATRLESHLDNLLFDRRQVPRVALVQEERTTGTMLLAAAIPLLTLPGLAMADNVGPLTVGTVQDLDDHDATRSRWGVLGFRDTHRAEHINTFETSPKMDKLVYFVIIVRR